MRKIVVFSLFVGVFFVFFVSTTMVNAYHEPWHDCISISGTTLKESTPNAGSILFSDSSLKLKGQNGEDDEVFDEDAETFTDNYPNNTAYRTCIDMDRSNQDEGNADSWSFDIRGWSYSDNLGWISFNCRDWEVVDGVDADTVCDAAGDYKTTIDFFGYLHGYAWSTTAGWIQFDWTLDGCKKLFNIQSCPTKYDDSYYHSTGGDNGGIKIQEGHVYDDWMDRNGIGSDGRFYGFAWNDSVGWFDFSDAFGVEDSVSFEGTNGDGQVWYPLLLELDARIVNSVEEIPYAYASGNFQGSVNADGLDEYQVQIRIAFGEEYFSDSDIESIRLALDWLAGEVDATEKDQLSPAGNSSVEYLFPDGASGYKSFSVDEFDYSGSDEYFTVAYIRSFAPTSNMNGVDMNSDGLIDVYNDGASLYYFSAQKIVIDDVNFFDDALDLLPIDPKYAGGVYFNNELYVDLKFRPAIYLASITSEGEYFINTSRSEETFFEVQLVKYLKDLRDLVSAGYVNNLDIDFMLGIKGMSNFEPFEKYDSFTPIHFVFDSDADGSYEYDSDSNHAHWKNDNGAQAGSGLDQDWNTWLDWVEAESVNAEEEVVVTAVPVLQPSGSAEERVENPSIASEIAYKLDTSVRIDGESDSGIVEISYYGPSLNDEVSEAVYNPSIDIQSGTVNVRDIVNIQEGDELFSVGDIRTNMVRNALYKSMKGVTRGAEVPFGVGIVSESSISGGAELFSGKGTVYYFSDKDVAIEHSGGVPDFPGAVYGNVGWSDRERTIVVEGGNLFINANLALDSADKQIGILVFRNSIGAGGNIYVHPSVTNVRAVMYADGVIAGYDGDSINVTTRESSGDWNGDGVSNTTYNVPDVDLFKCDESSADPEDVFRHQFLFTGVLAVGENTIGGADADPWPRIGTGDTFVNAGSSAKALAKQYDLNYFRSFKLVLERNDDGYIKDQQCGYWYDPYGGRYYDDNGALIADIGAGENYPFGCDGIVQDMEENGGDLIVPTGSADVCENSAMASGADSFDSSYKYSPFIVVYEAISPTLPIFSVSESGMGTQELINR